MDRKIRLSRSIVECKDVSGKMDICGESRLSRSIVECKGYR